MDSSDMLGVWVMKKEEGKEGWDTVVKKGGGGGELSMPFKG